MFSCSACVRLPEEGWVLRNSGGAEPPAAAIFCHRLTAALGLYPARAASSRPIRSASFSLLRLLAQRHQILHPHIGELQAAVANPDC